MNQSTTYIGVKNCSYLSGREISAISAISAGHNDLRGKKV
jgi:hypothetical protein